MASNAAGCIAESGSRPKPNRVRRAAAGALAVSLNIPVSLATALVLTPFYLHRLGELQYGAWLAGGYLFTVLNLTDPGVGETLTRQISQTVNRGNSRDVLNILRFTTASSMLLAGVVLFCGLPFAWFITRHMTDSLRLALMWGVAGLAIQLASGALGAIAAGFERSDIQGLVSVVSSLIGSIASGVGVAVLGVVGLGVGIFVTSSMYFIGTLWVAWQVATPSVGPTWCRPALSVGVWPSIKPFVGTKVISKLGNLMLGEIDRVFVAVALGPAAVPVFTLTKRPGDMARQLVLYASWASVAPLTGAVTENPKQADKLVHAVWRPLATLSIMMATMVYWLTPGFVRLWVGEAQFSGKPTLTYLCVYFACAGLSLTHINILWSLGAVRWLPWITIFEGVIYTSGALALVGRWGYVGIAAMMCLGQLTVTVPMTTLLLQRTAHIRITSDLARLAGIALLVNGILALLMSRVLGLPRSWTEFVAHGACVGLTVCLPFAQTIRDIAHRLRR